MSQKKPYVFYVALIGACFLLLVAIIGPYMTFYDPTCVELSEKLLPASSVHWLGTDHMGRDVLARLIYGTRLSLSIAIVVTFINLLIGIPVGLIVGWFNRFLDKSFTWFSNLVMAFPPFLLSMAFAGILGQGIINIIIAVSSVGWVNYSRVVRNMVLTVKDHEYVLSAKTMGASTGYILRKHIFPFVYKPILIMALMNLGEIVLMISGFSFLGIGVQPNVAEWGMMLNDAKSYFRSIPGLAIYPGLAILFTVVIFNLLGEYFSNKEKIRL